jgi:methionyl-tRNA synthetase
MPSTSASILEQLNAPARTVPVVLGTDILAGHTIGKPDYLFKKIDEKAADAWRIQYGGSQAADSAAGTATGSKPESSKKAKKAQKKAKADPQPVLASPAEAN